MKKGILFIIILALVGASIFIIIDLCVRASYWTGVLLIPFLLAAGYLYGKTNFKTDDSN